MAIELYWDNDEQTIMLCEVRGNWTWNDLFDALNKIKKVTDSATYEIAAIVDVTDGVSLPGGSIFNPTALENAKKMLKMGEGGTGPVVIVGASPMIRTVYDGFRTIDRNAMKNVHFAKTLDEAREVLSRIHTPANPAFGGSQVRV